jgi:hypothetical protein
MTKWVSRIKVILHLAFNVTNFYFVWEKFLNEVLLECSTVKCNIQNLAKDRDEDCKKVIIYDQFDRRSHL